MQLTRTGTFIAGAVMAFGVGGGTAVATGSAPVLLGRGNPTTATTGLANTKGTPLSLVAKRGAAPLRVNSTIKVTNLDSDLLDGKDSKDFLAVAGKATDSGMLNGAPASAFLAAGATAADSAKLGGQPASSYTDSVYVAQTMDTPRDPLISARTTFDAVIVPAGTYSVALAAQVQNNDNSVASFRCQLVFNEPAGTDYGNLGVIGLFPTAPGHYPTAGTVVANQVIALPVATTISAFCYADEGDTSHTSFVSHSLLQATRLQDLHGTADAFAVTPI